MLAEFNSVILSILLWSKELMEGGSAFPENPTYTDIFNVSINAAGRNPVIFVIKNFEYIVKSSKSFMKELVDFIDKNGKFRQILVLLVSSDVSWVENSMVATLFIPSFFDTFLTCD